MSASNEQQLKSWWAEGDTPVHADSQVAYLVDAHSTFLTPRLDESSRRQPQPSKPNLIGPRNSCEQCSKYNKLYYQEGEYLYEPESAK